MMQDKRRYYMPYVKSQSFATPDYPIFNSYQDLPTHQPNQYIQRPSFNSNELISKDQQPSLQTRTHYPKKKLSISLIGKNTRRNDIEEILNEAVYNGLPQDTFKKTKPNVAKQYTVQSTNESHPFVSSHIPNHTPRIIEDQKQEISRGIQHSQIIGKYPNDGLGKVKFVTQEEPVIRKLVETRNYRGTQSFQDLQQNKFEPQ